MAVILRRMLRIGALPDDMRAQVDAEGVLFLAEFVPVTYRFSGSVPGKTAAKEIRSHIGALVLTSQRVLGTLSAVPKRAGRAIDQRWDAPKGQPPDRRTPTKNLTTDVLLPRASADPARSPIHVF
jgi:hypothetical protein